MDNQQNRFSRHRSEGDSNLTLGRRVWIEQALDAETLRWLEEDERYFIRQSLSTPCLNVLRAADALYLEDLRGRRYMDFHGNSVHQVGFANPRVLAAIEEQMKTLPFCPRRYTNLPAIRLAQKLARLAPGNLNKVLFAPGGATVVGMALQLARVATGRFKTVSLWDSFHGASLDAMSVGGEALFRHDIGPLLPGTEHAPPPDPSRCPWECGKECNLRCAHYIEYILEKEGDVGAVIAETVRSTPVIPPAGYWEAVRAACDKHGALLILDEIANGLGRTGRMFTCERYGVVPDMLVIGKGLGGGIFPLAALIAREDLDIVPDRALGHYTHEKNPVACAAALAALEHIEEENLIENARRVGNYALERMRQMMSEHELVAEVRGLGLLLGLVLEKDGKPAVDAAEQVLYGALAKGLSFKVSMGNVLTLTPPLTVSKEDMERALGILSDCLAEAAQG
ncbi:MAG: aspartate aminotransferase family protein [Acidobacteriota bacterium]